MIFLSPLIFLMPMIATCTPLPVPNGHLVWSKKVSKTGFKEGNNILYTNGRLYVNDNRCNIRIFDLDGVEYGKIDGETDASCHASLAFAVDSSFFIQTRTYNDTLLP